MNVLIVENEKPASDKLIRLLQKIDKDMIVAGIIENRKQRSLNAAHQG